MALHSLRRIGAPLAALALLSTAALPAQTVFSTFGAGDTYGGSGWTVTSADEGVTTLTANSFLYTAATGKVLSMLRVAAFPEGGGPLEIEFLHGSAIATASVLESWSVNAGAFGVASIFSLSSVLMPALTNGDTYWIELLAAPGQTGVVWGWNLSNTASAGLAQSGNGGATWHNAPGLQSGTFDVTVADAPSGVTPEPATLSLVAMGLVGIGGMARRRKR